MSALTSQHTSGRAWQPPSPEELQLELPQYDITALIGRGGMGAVYKGRQSSLDRTVAIKILPLSLLSEANADFAERFKNEARAMAKLDHPAIVHVYDFGETSSGLLYIVMEFIDGTDVFQMIKQQGRLPSAHAMAITAHVCDALQYAHEHKIIHRDIKPANVMVSNSGVVKVADFGLAKMTGTGETGLTVSGMAMGTPHYVAPEALTLGVDVDHRADIFAIGVMLYEMLTGKLPRGLFELPSMKVPGLDPRYDGIIAKALQDDRDARYPEVAAMRRDLDSILTQPVSKVDPAAKKAPAALPPAQSRQKGVARQAQRPPERMAPPPAQKPTASGAFAWIFVTIVLLAGGYYWMTSHSAPVEKVVSSSDTSEPEPATPSPPPVQAVTKTETPVAKPAPMPSTPSPAASAPSMPKPEPMQAPVPTVNVAPAPAPKISAEVVEVEAQLLKLKAEARTAEAQFNADVAKLDAGYIGRLDRKMAEEKAAGRLVSALVIEQEKNQMAKERAKKRVAKDPPLPWADPYASVPHDYKELEGLRQIYRRAYAQIVATQAANFKALADPLIQRLRRLENDYSEKDRVADANTMKAYREGLVAYREELLATSSSQGSKATVTTPPPASPKPTVILAFTNILGMKFVPVPGTNVMFCIHETRNADYAVYSKGSRRVDSKWKIFNTSGKEQHPVRNVSWEDARSFCKWLSKEEQKTYRLPTDHEWSMAVGIGSQEDASASAERKSDMIGGVYPWGGSLPPGPRDGNYRATVVNDGYQSTTPVMKFNANELGLYDLGGNVSEWCQDSYVSYYTHRVLRGGAYNVKSGSEMLSSHRSSGLNTNRSSYIGFRCVLEMTPQ